MNLEPLQKIVMTMPLERPRNGRVIGIKQDPDGSTSYLIEPRSAFFGPLRNGQRAIRINSKDIGKEIIIQTH